MFYPDVVGELAERVKPREFVVADLDARTRVSRSRQQHLSRTYPSSALAVVVIADMHRVDMSSEPAYTEVLLALPQEDSHAPQYQQAHHHARPWHPRGATRHRRAATGAHPPAGSARYSTSSAVR